jgi:hypothetical protein
VYDHPVPATVKLYDPVQGWFAKLPETRGYTKPGRFLYPSASWPVRAQE